MGQGRTSRSTAKRATAVLVLVLLCSGCAFSYIDGNGDRHAVGLVDITIHPPSAPQTFAGDVVDIASIGVTAGRTAQGGYITLGYSHEVSAALRDNALVLGTPLDPSRPKEIAKEGAP